MYYLLFIPSLCTLVLGSLTLAERHGRNWRKLAIVPLAVILMADLAVWGAVQRTPDDEYRQLLAWLPKHVANGATVAVTEDTAQFLLHGVILGQWATVPALIQHHVDYVLVSTKLASQGYGTATSQFVRYLSTHATVAFRVTGPSDGALILYNVRAVTGARK